MDDANALCRLMTTTLPAPNVVLRLASATLMLTSPVPSVEDGRPSNSEQWSKLRRSLVDTRAKASQRGRQHWTSAFSKLEVWILSRPALSTTSSGPALEISSLVSGDDFSDRLLVGTPSPLAQQDLVVQAQNWVSMVSGTATMAPSTATTVPSTATTAPSTAGPSTIEPIARPVLFKEPGQLLLLNNRQCSTAPCRMRRIRHPCHPCRIQHPCCQQGLLAQRVIMVRAISSLLCLTPVGCLRESRCCNTSSFRNSSSLRLGELAKPSLSLSPPLVHRGFQLRLRTMLRSFQ